MVRTAATLAILLSTLVSAADAGMPDIPEPGVRLLLPGGAPEKGVYRIGVEIDLPEDWHTYWRNPGDAGVPPQFDTSASGNLAGFAVAYPAPERWSDGTSTSVVYHGRTVLPVTVTAADPAEPIDLRVGFDFGFCKEICVPGHAALEATLDPGAAPDAAAALAVAGAEAEVPIAEEAAHADAPKLVSVERIGDDRKTAVLRLVVDAADPQAVDLFADPPDGWYLAVPHKAASEDGRAVFELPLKGMPKKADFAGARFRFTLVSPDAAVEATRVLD